MISATQSKQKAKRRRFGKVSSPALRWVCLLIFLTVNALPDFAQSNNFQITRSNKILSTSESKSLSLDFPQKPGEHLILRGTAISQISAESARNFFAVYVFDCEKNQRAPLPVQGKYQINANRIEFVPDFEFAAGTNYEAEIGAEIFGINEVFREWFYIARKLNLTPPKILQIYPTADRIPANALRFYIAFSEPMRRHSGASLVKLRDKHGREISRAFLSLNQELWSGDSRRLTLLLDPGRIKRGVTANLEIGPALVAGQTYEISVKPGWTSEQGGVSGEIFSKKFRVAAADRRPVDLKAWKIETPRNSTKDALEINFDRIFDYALLENCLAVFNESGTRVPGEITVDSGERNWKFKPLEKWTSGNYKIVAAADLEDIAGNRINEALDHDAGASMGSIKRFYKIPFSVAASTEAPFKVKAIH